MSTLATDDPSVGVQEEHGTTVRLCTGRRVPLDEYVGCGSIWDQLEDLTFRSPEAAARWVGRYWGWKSGVPSHIGDSSGGVGWWIHNTLLILNDPKARCSWWTLVPGTDVMMTGWHAELSFEARTAAGLVTLGVEEVASAWEV